MSSQSELKDFINGINKSVAQMIQDIEDDIENEFKSTLKKLKESEDKILADSMHTRLMKEYLTSKVSLIQNGSIQMTPENKLNIERTLFEIEHKTIPYLQSMPDKFQYTIPYFKFDG